MARGCRRLGHSLCQCARKGALCDRGWLAGWSWAVRAFVLPSAAVEPRHAAVSSSSSMALLLLLFFPLHPMLMAGSFFTCAFTSSRGTSS